MPKIVIANWKLNPATHQEAKSLCSATIVEATKHANVTTVICPPFLMLSGCAALVAEAANEHIKIGAQNDFWENSGAYTGETSPQLLKDSGASYVLIGHSERRALGETDEMVNKKVIATLAVGLIPVVFVGEKEKGEARQDILIDQLSQDLAGISSEDVKKLLVVYEPVWAISSHSPVLRQGFGGHGVSSADSPESTLEAIKIMREILIKIFPEVGVDIPILYGGSVNPENAAGFLSHPEISGAVVGSASLDSEKFGKILQVSSQFD